MPSPGRFLLGRLLQSAVTLWIVVTLVFMVFRMLPGDPTAAILDPTWPPEVRELILVRFGLDKSVPEQYFLYLSNLVRGDMGYSFFYARPVGQVIGAKLWNTLSLALAAFVLAYVLGIVLGVFTASRRGTWVESLVITVSLVFRSAPMFWMGMLFLMLFSFALGWLPSGGMRTPGYEGATFWSLDFLRHLLAPAVVSALHYMALPMMLLRNTMLEVLGEDFVELCRAKGIGERRVLYRHVARNALLPVVTTAAIYVGLAAGGVAVIETVFSWPGLGREIVLAVQRRDYPVAQGAFLILGATVILMNTFADLVYGYLDPRIKYGNHAK